MQADGEKYIMKNGSLCILTEPVFPKIKSGFLPQATVTDFFTTYYRGLGVHECFLASGEVVWVYESATTCGMLKEVLHGNGINPSQLCSFLLEWEQQYETCRKEWDQMQSLLEPFLKWMNTLEKYTHGFEWFGAQQDDSAVVKRNRELIVHAYRIAKTMQATGATLIQDLQAEKKSLADLSRNYDMCYGYFLGKNDGLALLHSYEVVYSLYEYTTEHARLQNKLFMSKIQGLFTSVPCESLQSQIKHTLASIVHHEIQSAKRFLSTWFVCDVCGQEAEQLCTFCENIQYCSDICMQEDWKAHKSACNEAILANAIGSMNQKSKEIDMFMQSMQQLQHQISVY